jgi:uncharacterized cupredoxin-like copper-binding protein
MGVMALGISPHRIGALLAAGAGAAVLLAGCGSGPAAPGTSTPTTGSTSAVVAPTSSAPAIGTRVTATETEYSITLSSTVFTPGVYTFDVVNSGTLAHDLSIEGPGVDRQTSPIVSPGGTGQLIVTLQKGSYQLSCSIDGHKDLGMDRTIQVG